MASPMYIYKYCGVHGLHDHIAPRQILHMR